MISKKIGLILVFFFLHPILGMEQVEEEQSFEVMQGSILYLPDEILTNILEFIFGLNSDSVKAGNIFEAFEKAKVIVFENGKYFALTCKRFNRLKDEFHKIAKRYLAQNWAKEYFGKKVESLNKILRELFISFELENKMITTAKLIFAGADVDTSVSYPNGFNDYKSPLILYIITEYPSYKDYNERILSLLFSYNVDIKVKDRDGNTALILAAKQKKSDLVRALLKNKDIEVDEQNLNGFTAMDYAKAYDDRMICGLLCRAKAVENPNQVKSLIFEIKSKKLADKFNEKLSQRPFNTMEHYVAHCYS